MAITMEEILATAVKAGASDVHVAVGASPKMRVNGSLVTMDYPGLLPADTLALLISIMSQAQRTLFEEHGEYDMSFEIPSLGRFRASAYKQLGFVSIALRVIGNGIPSPDALGIPEEVMELYQSQQGLILVAGPAGSGKSTTLAALIDRMNSMRDIHIITLESPIEYQHQNKRALVSQREIGLDCADMTKALYAAMREDADVIMLGEMWDAETVAAAVTAAETGHLVLAALHTCGVADTVERMIELFPFHQQGQMRMRIAGVLEAVVSQKLRRRESAEGRSADFEVLHVTEDVRERIQRGLVDLL